MTQDLEIEPHEYTIMLFGGLAIFLYIRMFLRTISMVFILNFGGGGLNPSIFLFFATLSGFIYLLISSMFYPHSNKFYLISIGLTGLSLMLTLIPLPILSLTFAVLFQISITPILVSILLGLRKKFAISAGIGILFNIFVLAITNFVGFYVSLLGAVILVLVSIVWMITGYLIISESILQTLDYSRTTSTSSLIGFIAIYAVLLGYPNALASWNKSSIVLITLLSVSSIILGMYVVMDNLEFTPHLHITASLGYMLSLIGVIFLDDLLLYSISISLIHPSAILLLSQTTRVKNKGTIKMLGTRMGGVQFLVLVIVFLQISTPFWTGLPTALQPILANNTRFFTFLLGLILPLSGTLAYIRRERE